MSFLDAQGLVITLFAGILHSRPFAIVWIVSSLSSATVSITLALALPVLAPPGRAGSAAFARLCIWLTRHLPCWDNVPIVRRVNIAIEVIYLLPGA
jgi:hypothetical protein